ncbi:hypothetical protein PG985_002545 [Apiospora marii]|uniref:SP-RING-type domain-containing protein n=1 Tax=Apiospora marii TaxID=335849 RepID=A0ABR1RT69_9PEZI
MAPGRRILSGSARQSRSSATPSSARQERRAGPLELPEYEAPSCPLDPQSRRQILDLATQQHSAKYSDQLANTLKMLEDSVRDINDNYAERKDELKTLQSKRREKGGGDDEANAQERALKATVLKLREVVPELTESSEEAVRDLIDWQVEVEDEKKALREIQALLEDEAREAKAHAELQADPDADLFEVKGPRHFFNEARDAQTEEYYSKSMYQKYGLNNDYVHFKKLWHDAVHSRDAQPPPVPDATRWFGQQGGGGGGDEAGDSDEDLVVAGEVQDFRCPLSMVVMKEPYTSRLCKHSFEKAAILEYLPKNGTSKECPVAGCDKHPKKSDLYFDDLLVRRIKRATARQSETQDDDVDEDDEDEDGDTSMQVTSERDVKTERGWDRGRRLIEDIMGDE